MKPTVYWMSGSPFAWRVLLAAALKQVDVESKLLSFRAGDNKEPSFLAKSPRGKVPVLEHDGNVVRDSLAIIVYLDRAFPAVPLLGATAAEAATIWTMMLELDEAIGTPARRLARACFRNKVDVDVHGPDVDALLAEFEAVERQLDGQEFVAGAISGVDVLVYPSLMQLMHASGFEAAAALPTKLSSFPQRFPLLFGWKKRLEARPGVRETYPPHWNQR